MRAPTWVLAVGAALCGSGDSCVAEDSYGRVSTLDSELATRTVASFSNHLQFFEKNLGQADKTVKFMVRARGLTAFLTGSGIVVVGANIPGSEPDVFRISFPGASRTPLLVPGRPIAGVSHYLVGNDPRGWIPEVPHFEEVTYQNLWPGIDLRWRFGSHGALAFDLLIAPGANPRQIAMSFSGGQPPEVDTNGALRVASKHGCLSQSRPVLYQRFGGHAVRVLGGYSVRPSGAVGFAVAKYRPELPLIIDPELKYATYLGGSGSDLAYDAVALGSDGSMFIAGESGSANFPIKDAYRSTPVGKDLFLTKLNPSGSALVYSTFIGGSGTDNVGGLDVDSNDAPILTGWTQSSDYPVANAVQAAASGGSQDAVVTKLTPAGSSLAWSTYLGGGGADSANSVRVDSNGAVFVIGRTLSSNFPTKNPLQGTSGGSGDVFLVKYKSDGSAYEFATYLGGSADDEGNDVEVTDDGQVVIVGSTYSTNFPVESALYSSKGSSLDAFVARLAADGQSLDFSTYLGGNGTDEGRAVALASTGDILIAGVTDSSNFPTASPFQAARSGVETDAFVTKLKSDGSSIDFSTYYGGADSELVSGIAVNYADEAVIAGYTTSADLPRAEPTQGTFGGIADGFVARFGASGETLDFATYFGGSKADRLYGVALDEHIAVLVGNTESTDMPTKSAYQGTKGGTSDSDAVLVRLDVGQGPPLPPSDLVAQLVSLTAVELTWTDNSDNETGFRVERRSGVGSFSPLATTAANVVLLTDSGLTVESDYTYRVYALNDRGDSPPSNEAPISTPGIPSSAPVAPTGLSVTGVTPTSALLTWVDNSSNEDFFVVARSTDGVFFNTLATPRLGSTSYTDTTPLPDHSYTYRVRAVNPVGSSLSSNDAVVKLAPSLEPHLAKGLLKNSSSPGRDKLVLTLAITSLEGSVSPPADPVLHGLSLKVGGWNGASVLSIPPLDAGWREKKKYSQWKSPKGSSTKATVKWTPASGVAVVSLSGLNLPASIENPITIAVGLSQDGGSTTDLWVEGKKSWKFVE